MTDVVLLTTDLPPEGFRVKTTYSLVQVTGTVQISNKNIVKAFLDRNRNEYQEILEAFSSSVPAGANAILGVQVATSAQAFSNGTFLHMTYIGTAVELEQITEEVEGGFSKWLEKSFEDYLKRNPEAASLVDD